jgi:hypothetical protein
MNQRLTASTTFKAPTTNAEVENATSDRGVTTKKPYSKPGFTVTAYDDLAALSEAVSEMAARCAGGEDNINENLPKVRSKKPYSTPKIRVYGHIQTLTSTVGAVATSDGGAGAMNRTH